jgi:hypothetical protein
MIGHFWSQVRYWIAGKIVGLDILDEVNSAYESGREWGRTERWGFNKTQDDVPTV